MLEKLKTYFFKNTHSPSARFLPESERSEYITLKEAATLTDYAPDYIGQLIRSGKIEGHQVYTSVSWVTTEKAVREYLRSRGKSGDRAEEDSRLRNLSVCARHALYVVIGCLVCILIVFLYIFIIGIDRAMTNSYDTDFTKKDYGI